MSAKKVLFILKKRKVYQDEYTQTLNSGLFTSAMMVNSMINKIDPDDNDKFISHIVQVDDNNDIDREVTAFEPNVVIIEALWVVPEKIEVLKKLHPKVTWIIRLHSEVPFIANEGIAIDWIKQYVKMDKVFIGCNSKYMVKTLQELYGCTVAYLPNYYKAPKYREGDVFDPNDGALHVGCFGAIRPMKNHLVQAMAAIQYANVYGKKLYFHINSNRIEQNGSNVLKNLRALFEGSKHILKEWDWLSHEEFTMLVATMDIGLQVSMSETYNIVTADFVNQSVPVVTSREITFVSRFCRVSRIKDTSAIFRAMERALGYRKLFACWNRFKLTLNSRYAQIIWKDFLINNF